MYKRWGLYNRNKW